MTSIRPAVATDGPRLVALDRATWSPENAVAPRQDDAAADFFGRRPPGDVLVAEDDGLLVGYTQFGRPTPLSSNEHVLHIQGLAVDPSARGRGVARLLLEAAGEEAARRGARKLGLRVLGGNTAARALYESAGFEVEGVLREEFLLDGRYVDDVLMARRLT